MAQFVRKTWMAADLSFGRKAPTPAFEYLAYVPDPLCGREFEFSEGCVAQIDEAEAAIRSLNINAKLLYRAEGLARLLLRAEATASSMIEGIEMPIDRVLRAEAAREFKSRLRRDYLAREVLGNVDAMTQAIDAAVHEPKITLDTLLTIHHHLMIDTTQSEIAGRVRTGASWIGGSPYDPSEAKFVPPPVEEVVPLLTDVAEFCNDTSLPSVAQAALAHAQFETIHPFPDGNGRVGRALIHLILRRRGVAPCWCTPVSLVLATLHKEYIRLLRRWSYDGPCDSPKAIAAIDEWVAFFARACTRSVHDAHLFESYIHETKTMWRERLRREELTTPMNHLIDELPGTPVVTAASASRLLGKPEPEAQDLIDTLVRARVLNKVRLGGGNFAYEATQILRGFTSLERRLASPIGDTMVSPPVRAVPKKMR